MIAKLTGQLDTLEEDALIIDVNGVGYHVGVSTRTLSTLTGHIGPLSLLIETLVRQEETRLYGFLTVEERQWFRLLLTVQGVGAKVALALLSVLDPNALAHAIAMQDQPVICRAEGVGPKLANRIISELKDKIGKIAVVTHQPAAIENEALSALINLGYRRQEALQALSELGPQADIETLIRQALQRLSNQRAAHG